MDLFSKSRTVEIKDVAVTRVSKLKRCIFMDCVTPNEIILILFQVIAGKEGDLVGDNEIKYSGIQRCICNRNLVFNFHA